MQTNNRVFNGKRLVLSLVTTLALTTTSLLAKDVYATVDGENITKDDISVVLRNPKIDFDTLPEKTQETVINQLVEKKLLTKKALSSGIEKEATFKEALEKIKKDLALEIWMQEEFKKVSVSDKEIKEYYTKNEEKFKTDEKLKARHILLKDEAAAKSVIKELNGAKDKLAKFTELAKSKSTGPTGKNGGSLGEFSAKQMVPEFSKAASALKKGAYTKSPVKTQFGYHVIYLEDKTPAQKLSFDDVKVKIKQALIQEKFRNNIKDVVSELRKKANISIK
ncbi:peptidylprolyl isomerase [Candidatus Marinarcus aquaticus]|uniref:Peptidylprolyl isomerase n=1 Tax=Candidatus Marinarcus aquaticus TaxID=2044504 RepID=A0A4Q0XSA6_9BACT|nr:peptidyl-prolyl cis-trans isomerase [Candidatus Marinarcus aquaticus]RXJ57586.1 peptidylprolyl isomerase [Candidatus Marinarcus aquaticus]